MSWPQNMSNKNVGYYIKTAVYIVMFRKAASYNRYEHNNPDTGLALLSLVRYDLNFAV